ncbi:uncharacterized protein LOC125000721 isoform X2 [Mugil cephalus]|uniref:uncharacterized protein LOC125000721 isoform X2 n=1 Tax=Mugil cephalus TaxID=48193 RepID=UPI001FB85D92|nr:uncharacterized protein LOC125000721 isoform X2 [Mugil cephalus]
MACTTQSALDYVRSARIHLVGEFKNLSVILENLYQKNVLSDEEVSKIQAERDDYDKTRKILDSVIKKGEAACYELLRIIDTTRKRTLKSDASTEARKFDLHHWISCFSFKEDPQGDINNLQGPKSCHRYQAKLKSKARRLSNEFWMTSRKLFAEKKLDLSYTSLVLDTQDNVSPSKIKKFKRKKSKMIRPKKLRTYIPEDKAEISPSDLLKTYKNIVLVGKPGIGKTALTHEVLRLWAERDNKELDYMFYFDMRETSNITAARSLEELLFNVSIGPEEGAEEVLDDMKRNSDNVTIILDGITDLCSSVVKRLVEKDLLPDAKIILTCRPADEEDFFYGDCVRVEVKGFSEQTIRSYLSAALGEEQEKIVTNLELVTLCHVPVYALMVAACFSSGGSPQPCTETEIYINIVRHCLQINSNKTKNKDLNSFISTNKNEILSLAEVAFLATRGKTVNLTEVSCEDSCVLSFLKPLLIKAACTETETIYAFLHYTVQEFFAALWLLKNPDQIRDVLKQCLTEEMRHMKHLIPFMCRLLSERKPTLMRLLIPADDLKNTSDWFLKEMITTFSPGLKKQGVDDSEDSGLNVDILFLCQCLYESQSPEACIYLLDRLDYQLDLSEESLDCSPCCALAYVLSQHKERKAQLNLEDATISEQGMRQLFGCLENVQWCDPLPQQLWKIFLLSDRQMDYVTLLGKAGNQLHLPVEGKRRLFDRAVEVMQRMTKKMNKKVNVCLYGDRVTSVCQNLCESLLQALPYISSLSFNSQTSEPSEETRVFGNLFCAAAERENQTGEKIVELLSSVCRYKTFPLKQRWCDFLLDLYSDKTETGLRLLPSLQSVFQFPTVWSIDLSERKTSILLEVMKLQSEKKPVELRGCSHEESEVRSFLQCLPYISQLRFVPWSSDPHQQTRFLLNLFCAAAERENQTGEKIVELLSSVCKDETFSLDEDYMDYMDDDDDDDDDDDKKDHCDLLLDLCSHVKDYETKTGLRLLPSFQSVFQSAPTVWFIDLSERKTSILLEVMKLQSEKKPVELRGCSHEESEVRSFLQCLPYISQLRFDPQSSNLEEQTKFLFNLFCAAAERENQTGEKIVELLSSVCTYQTFPSDEDYMDDDDKYPCDFLLDLCSHVKDYETKTGLRLLPSLQSVFQSPIVWFIDLSERITSIVLEVMKLQSEKKPVMLRGCSHEESEVRSFLQCLPYISELRFVPWSSDPHQQTRFLLNLFCAAAERENQTGEKIVELLSSVCKDETFSLDEDYMDYMDDDDDDDDDDKKDHCDLLLDLCSHVKDYETKTGLRLLPSFQSVFQSAPTVWFIDLSERKTSILLEVMKLQSEKKPVELRGCSHEESEVRSFLQCLPYISQLSCPPEFFQSVCSSISVRSREDVHQLSSLLQLLDFNLILTGKLRRKTCCSVGRVLHLCGSKVDLTLTALKMSVRGASNLFRRTTCLHSLRLSNNMVPFLCQWIRRGRLVCPLVVEELHLVPQTVQPSDRLMLEVVSSLSSLLRYWTVRLLDLTESCISAQCLMSLLLHDGPLTLKLSEEILQQLLTLVHEVQDKHLTLSLLSKVGGDLSSCRLDWELLHYLLQSSDQIITVNLRKNRFLQENTTRLLPFLDRMVLTRPSPSFVMTSIRELYRAQAGLSVPGLLRSLDHVISLSCRELDSVDCAALLFVLKHSDRVKLNLLWTSIPGEGLQSILSALDRVSQLSVDRNQLLRFIHCCAASDDQQGASSGLLRTLQHSLDLSCSSCVETPEEAQTESLSLTGDDCRVVSTVLRHSSMDTQLDLRHCEVEDSGLELLFPVLDRVHLRVSKTVLLQLVSLVPVHSEEDTVRRAVSLCGALGGELDLSHSRLDQRTCGALVQMLEFSEGLTELDLSHCQLTDQLLLPLSSQLHKVQVLDLSHNQITDASTDLLLQLPSINPSIHTVRLFSNKIKDRTPFKKHQHFEIW